MYRKTVKYKNYHGNEVTRDLWFNISDVEAMNMGLAENNNGKMTMALDRLAELREAKEGDTIPQNVLGDFVEYVESIVIKAYGEISDDGESFNKSPEISQRFENSAAYNALITELIQDPDELNKLFEGMLPDRMKDQIREQGGAEKVVDNYLKEKENGMVNGKPKPQPIPSNYTH